MTEPLFFIGTVQPDVPEASGPSADTTHWTEVEKPQLADAITERAFEWPVVLEHAEAYRDPAAPLAEDAATAVAQLTPVKARIGRIDAAMVDRHGDLIVVGQTYAHLPETRALIDGINTRGEKWGLSPGSVMIKSFGAVEKKIPGHVGITRQPEYGDEGAWLHVGAMSMHGLLPELRRYMDEPGMYVPPAMRATYEPLFAAAESKRGAAIVPITASRPSGSFPSNTMSAAETSAPPVPVPTEAAPPPAAAAVEQTPEQRAELEALCARVLEKYGGANAGSRKDRMIEFDAFDQSDLDRKRLVDLMGPVPMSNYPEDVQLAIYTILQYEKHNRDAMLSQAKVDAGTDTETFEKQAKMIRDHRPSLTHENKNFRPALMSVVASHNKDVKHAQDRAEMNQRMAEEQLKREQEILKREREIKEERQKWEESMRAELKRKAEEAPVTEVPVADKRSRLELPNAVAQPAAAAPAAGSTLLVATASRGANDSVHLAKNFLVGMEPTMRPRFTATATPLAHLYDPTQMRNKEDSLFVLKTMDYLNKAADHKFYGITVNDFVKK